MHCIACNDADISLALRYNENVKRREQEIIVLKHHNAKMSFQFNALFEIV